MARILGRSPATVSREVTRNSSPADYASVPAEAVSAPHRGAVRRPAKLCLQSVCWRIVLTLLDWKWSPQQISGTLKRMYPTHPTQQVSHATPKSKIVSSLVIGKATLSGASEINRLSASWPNG